MTTRRMMLLVGGMALLFGVAVEIRRALNQKARDRIIAAYSRSESEWRLWAERARARAKEFSDMEQRALELVRTGEFTPEAGQRRARFRQSQREFWEAEAERCRGEAEWYAGRANQLRTESASATLFDFASEKRLGVEHAKKRELGLMRQASNAEPPSAGKAPTSQP
jgi:hypothetical protein